MSRTDSFQLIVSKQKLSQLLLLITMPLYLTASASEQPYNFVIFVCNEAGQKLLKKPLQNLAVHFLVYNLCKD